MEVEAISTIFLHCYVEPEELRRLADVLEDEMVRRAATMEGKLSDDKGMKFGSSISSGGCTLYFHPPKIPNVILDDYCRIHHRD